MDAADDQPETSRLVRESVILPDSIRDTALSVKQSTNNDDQARNRTEDKRLSIFRHNETMAKTAPNFSQVLAIGAAQRSIRVWKRSLRRNDPSDGSMIGEGRAQSLERRTKYRSDSPEKAAPKVVTLEDRLGPNTELDVIGNLNLSGLKISDGDVRTILQRKPWERQKCLGIILRDNDLTSFGIYLLVDGLVTAKAKLKYLSLSNNPRVGDEGIEQIVRLLKSNRSMTFLSLPNTGISDRGVRLLADALCGVDKASTCARLEKLHISYNKLVTDQSVDVLLEILKKHPSMKSLWVQNCSLSDAGRERLRKAQMRAKKRFSISD